MENIYNDSTYLNNNPTWHEEDAPYKAGKILRLIKEHPVSFKTVCDIGCGSGELLVQLAAKLDEVEEFLGVDISKDVIAVARRKETEKIKFELANSSDPAPKEVFDLLLVIDVIEHVENYFSFLDQIASKGRYTIFHIPLDMCVWSLFREQMLIESKARVGHIHNFTESFIESVLMDKGFKIIGKLYTEPIDDALNFKQRLISQLRKVIFRLNKKFCTKTLGGYSILLLTENNRLKGV